MSEKAEKVDFVIGQVYQIKTTSTQAANDLYKYIKIGEVHEYPDEEFKKVATLRQVFVKQLDGRWSKNYKLLLEQQIEKNYDLFLETPQKRESRLDDIE